MVILFSAEDVEIAASVCARLAASGLSCLSLMLGSARDSARRPMFSDDDLDRLSRARSVVVLISKALLAPSCGHGVSIVIEVAVLRRIHRYLVFLDDVELPSYTQARARGSWWIKGDRDSLQRLFDELAVALADQEGLAPEHRIRPAGGLNSVALRYDSPIREQFLGPSSNGRRGSDVSVLGRAAGYLARAASTALRPAITAGRLLARTTDDLIMGRQPVDCPIPSAGRGELVRSRLRRWATRVCYSFRLGEDAEALRCTVFASRVAERGHTSLIQVFAHRPEQASRTSRSAKDADGEAVRRAFKSLQSTVRRGARLDFSLSVPALRVATAIQSLVWRGEPESAQFEVPVPGGFRGSSAVCTVTICVDGAPAGHIRFALAIRSPAYGQPNAAEACGDEIANYSKVFISYASEDRQEVLKRVQMLSVLKVPFFQDMISLDAGTRWERELFRQIDEADLFLLFWSSAARRSEWVLREVDYAMKRKAGDDIAPPRILPVLLEGPPPVAPPEALAHIQFNDPIGYFLLAGRSISSL